jgi:hypothetical protein
MNTLEKSYSESKLETESDSHHNTSKHSLMSHISPHYVSKDSITVNENTLSLEDMGSLTQQSSIGNDESKQEVKFLVGRLNYENSDGTTSRDDSKSVESYRLGGGHRGARKYVKHKKGHQIMVSPRDEEERYYITYDKHNDQNVMHHLSSKWFEV